ncbi:MFS transporter [Streptomyces sp. RM72]|uniref:MFS transporter n=1 Tax=Streptomyces sp. RM72 TaxID=1115510 RepID=UPI001B369E2C|nr:MFS transporter [Streptomyces sp. RM72]MBQ0890696.1 MFS transporter [Streptomyces sp. RM72]
MATHAPATTAVPIERTARSAVRVLIIGSLLVKAGGFSWDFLAYYVGDGTNGTGHGTTAAGAALTAFGIGWCLGQASAGALTDRLGQRTALVALMILSAAACLALAVATSLPALLAVAVCLGLTMEAHRPAVSAAINEAIPTEAGRTRAQTWTYFASNVGIAVCGGAGGYLAHHHGYRTLFVVNAVVCLAFALIARRTLAPKPPTTDAPRVTYRQVWGDPTLRWITLVAVCSMVCAWGLVSVLPLLMTSDGLPATSFGVAMVANTVAVLALTPPLMRLLVGRGDTVRFPFVPVLAIGSAFLGLGITIAAFQHTVLGYAIAAAVLVPGEVFYSVAVGAYISTAAPPGATGRYQAVISGATALASLPPLGIALALEAGGRPLVAALLAASAALAVVACLPLARSLRARTTRPDTGS